MQCQRLVIVRHEHFTHYFLLLTFEFLEEQLVLLVVFSIH